MNSIMRNSIRVIICVSLFSFLSVMLRNNALENESRVLCVGIRSLGWESILNLKSEDKMKNLSRVMSEGVCGDILAKGYASDAHIHASVISGQIPERHGVTSYSDPLLRHDTRLFSSIWDFMEEDGDFVKIIGFSMDRYVPAVLEPDPAVSKYSELVQENEELTEAALNALGLLLSRDYIKTKLAVAELSKEERSHVFVYLDGLHKWKGFLASQKSGVTRENHAGLILRYYLAIDEMIGMLFESADFDTTCILYSEEGARGGRLSYRSYMPDLALDTSVGVFVAWGNNIKAADMTVSVTPVDIVPTLLYVTGKSLPNLLDGVIVFDVINDGYYFKNKINFRH